MSPLQTISPQKWIQKEWVWVTFFSIILFFYMQHRGELDVEKGVDSDGYLSVSQQPLGLDSLKQNRTLGYPLFLKACHQFLSVDLIPAMQLLMFIGSIFLFSFALKRLGISTLCNVSICAVLLLKSKTVDLTHLMLSDSLGYTCSVATAACLLAVIKPRAHWGWWAGLILALFSSYQVRPVYLCLIPAVVISLIIGRWVYERGHFQEKKTKYLRFGTIAVAIAFLPLIVFFTMRYVLVDHFGLVSYGGYNIVGIAGNLLEEEDIAHLSPASQLLAHRIVQQRNNPEIRKKLNQKSATWQPVVRKEKGWDRIDHPRLLENYNFIIWGIAVSGAFTQVSDQHPEATYEEKCLKINQVLSSFSKEVIQRHKADYSFLLAESFWAAVTKVYIKIRLVKRLAFVWLALFVGRMIYNIFIKKNRNFTTAKQVQSFANASVVVIVSSLFFLSNIGLVIAVEPPIYRYVAAAAGLLPTIGLVFCFYELEMAKHLFARIRGRTEEDAIIESDQTNDPAETNTKMAA